MVSPLSHDWGWWWGGQSTKDLGPLTQPPPPYPPFLLVDVIIMWTSLYLWNIIAWLVSTQVLFQQGLIVLLFHSWMPWLVCYLYSVRLSLRICICFIGRFFTSPPPPNAQLLLWEGPAPPFTVSTLIVFCEAAGKQWADEETLNRSLEALCTLQAEWSHCK